MQRLTRYSPSPAMAGKPTMVVDSLGDYWRISDVEAAVSERWQPMETMPEEGQVIVCWSVRPSGGVDSNYDTIGRSEYLEIIGYGEPPALGWMSLPSAPSERVAPPVSPGKKNG